MCVIRGIPYDDLAASAGLEPATLALTGRCSGQLELRSHMVSRAGLEPARFSVVGLRPTAIAAMPPADNWSGWRDSNSRPSGPRPDALRKLSYAPKIGAPDRSRTCTERILIPIPLPELGYWSIIGAVNGDRTRDLRLGKPIFCQLNYYCMVHDAGLEPAPFCL